VENVIDFTTTILQHKLIIIVRYVKQLLALCVNFSRKAIVKIKKNYCKDILVKIFNNKVILSFLINKIHFN
jgi:hypothetical protein